MSRRNKRTVDGQAFVNARTRNARDVFNFNRGVNFNLTVMKAIRSLSRYNPFIQSYLKQLTLNVIGDTGPRPILSNVSNSKDAREIKQYWDDFMADPTVHGKENWGKFLKRVLMSYAIDGRVFLVTKRDEGYPMNIAFQDITREHLYGWASYNRILSVVNKKPQKLEINGVTYNVLDGVAYLANGRIAGYVFQDLNNYPNTSEYDDILFRSTGKKVFVSENIIMDFGYPDRDNQKIPEDMLSIVHYLYKIGVIEDSTLNTMVSASKKMGFIGQDLNAEETETKNLNKPEEDSDMEEEEYLPPPEFDPNTIEMLPAGYNFEKYDPVYPNVRADNFRKEMLKSLAASVGLDYASLMGDLEKVNYSSIRHGAIQAQDRYRVLQRQLEEEVTRPVFQHTLDEAVMTGALRFNNRRTYEEALAGPWRHRTWQWVDPLKDINAAVVGMQIGVLSPQMVAEKQGTDVETVIADVAEYVKILAKYNLTPQDLQSVAGAGSFTNVDDKPAEQQDMEDDLNVQDN